MVTASDRLLNSEGDIDLRVLVARLRNGKWWVLTSIVIFGGAFAAAAFSMTPIYRATTVVVDATVDRSGMGSLSSALGQLGGLASLAGINVGSAGSQAEETLAVMRSREFTEAFIRDFNLLTELFHARWDSANDRWEGEQPTLAQAFSYFNSQVRTVSQDRGTGLIRVQIDWKDPEQAALWANELVARLNAEMRARAIDSTNASVGYLEKELMNTATVETRQAINRLMEAQINQRMLANVTQEYALRVVDKALPPDPDDVVKPKKAVLLVVGVALGFLVGMVGVIIAGGLWSRQ